MINTRNYGSTLATKACAFRTALCALLVSLLLVHTGSHAAPLKSKAKSTTAQTQTSSKSASKDEQKFKAMVHRVAKDVGVDPALLMAVVKVESNFDQHATNPSGPMGLMQITHTTAKTVAPNISRRELMLPEKNLRVGALHLKQLLQDFRDPKLALAAYQAGAGKVKQKGHHVLGNPHTAGHVNKVMQHYQSYRGHSDLTQKTSRARPQKVALTRRR